MKANFLKFLRNVVQYNRKKFLFIISGSYVTDKVEIRANKSKNNTRTSITLKLTQKELLENFFFSIGYLLNRLLTNLSGQKAIAPKNNLNAITGYIKLYAHSKTVKIGSIQAIIGGLTHIVEIVFKHLDSSDVFKRLDLSNESTAFDTFVKQLYSDEVQEEIFRLLGVEPGKKVNQLSPKTVKIYLNFFRSFLKWLKEYRNEINKKLEDYLTEYKKENPLPIFDTPEKEENILPLNTPIEILKEELETLATCINLPVIDLMNMPTLINFSNDTTGISEKYSQLASNPFQRVKRYIEETADINSAAEKIINILNDVNDKTLHKKVLAVVQEKIS